MIFRCASMLLLLVVAAMPAAAQNWASAPAPTPAPLAPPMNPGPAAPPPEGLSPLLSQPGSMYSAPPAGPSYPAPSYPTPLGQQQMQTYRSDLLSQRWQLERQGVGPDNERYRELQQQLNQPRSR